MEGSVFWESRSNHRTRDPGKSTMSSTFQLTLQSFSTCVQGHDVSVPWIAQFQDVKLKPEAPLFGSFFSWRKRDTWKHSFKHMKKKVLGKPHLLNEEDTSRTSKEMKQGFQGRWLQTWRKAHITSEIDIRIYVCTWSHHFQSKKRNTSTRSARLLETFHVQMPSEDGRQDGYHAWHGCIKWRQCGLNGTAWEKALGEKLGNRSTLLKTKRKIWYEYIHTWNF